MTVVAQGEVELRLSKASAAAIEKDLAAVAGRAGGAAGGSAASRFSQGFKGRFAGLLGPVESELSKFAKTGELAFSPLAAGQGVLGGLANGLSEIGPVTAVAGAGLLAVGAIAVKGLTSFVSLADQIRRFKEVSGTTAQESSKFVVALNELGVSSDSVGRGIGRLARQTVDGRNPLAEFGIEIKRTKDGNFDAVGSFDAIADKIHNTTDAAARNAIAFKAFGRSGAELIPLLARGSEGLKQFEDAAKLHHEIFSDADLKAARDYSIAVRSLGESFQGLEISLGRNLAGPLTNFTTGVTLIVDHTTSAVAATIDFGKQADKVFPHVAEIAGTVGLALGTIFAPEVFIPVDVAVGITALGAESRKSSDNLKQLAVDESAFATQAKADADRIKGASQSLSFLSSSLRQTVLTDTLSTFGAAAEGAAITFATNEKGVTDYSKALASLDPIAERVVADQEKIQLGLDPIAAKFDIAAAAADQFNTALGYTLGAFEGVQQTAINVTRAEDTLTKTLGSGVVNADAVAKATLGVTSANDALAHVMANTKHTALDVQKAQQGVAVAQERLNKASKGGTVSITDLKEGALRLVEALQAENAAQIAASDGTITAKQGRDNFIVSLDKEIKRYPALAGELKAYRDQIVATPDSKLIDFRQKGLDAVQGSIDTLNATLQELTRVFEIKFHIDPKTVQTALDAASAEAKATGFVLTLPGVRTLYANPPTTPTGAAGAPVPAPYTFLPNSRGSKQPGSRGGSRGRAGGGNVLAGHPYIVGEYRAEEFTPESNGTIDPHPERRQRGSGVAQVNTFHVYDSSGNPEVTARKTSAILGRSARR